MTTRRNVITCAGITLALATLQLVAQQMADPWTQVCDLPGGEAMAVGADPTGQFVLAAGDGPSGPVALLSQNSGVDWETDHPLDPGGVLAVAFNSTQAYFGGQVGNVWTVRSCPTTSLSSVPAWSLEEQYNTSPGAPSVCEGLATASDTVFATGSASQTRGNKLWLTRRQIGGAWMPADTVSSKSGPCVGRAVGVNPATRDIYAVGAVGGGGNLLTWTIRRSLIADNGAPGTWRTVDSFPAPYNGSQARAIAFDGNGNIYVAGYTTVDKFGWVWAVRRGDPSGNSWSTIDLWRAGSSGYNVAWGITVTPANIYVCGYGERDLNSRFRWVVRHGSLTVNGEATWDPTPIDDWSLDLNQSAIAHAVVAARGNVIVVGGAGDSNGVYHWIAKALLGTP